MRAAIWLVQRMSWYAPVMIPSANGDVHLWTFDEEGVFLADDKAGSRPGDLHGPQ